MYICLVHNTLTSLSENEYEAFLVWRVREL